MSLYFPIQLSHSSLELGPFSYKLYRKTYIFIQMPNLRFLFLLAVLAFQVTAAPRPVSEFKWINPPKGKFPNLHHKTFKSPSMGIEVGYNIFLPPEYENDSSKRFPVIYYLHGGRPGSESKSIKLTSFILKAMESGKVPGMIYVFVNGGKVSHYNMPKLELHG